MRRDGAIDCDSATAEEPGFRSAPSRTDGMWPGQDGPAWRRQRSVVWRRARMFQRPAKPLWGTVAVEHFCSTRARQMFQLPGRLRGGAVCDTATALPATARSWGPYLSIPSSRLRCRVSGAAMAISR